MATCVKFGGVCSTEIIDRKVNIIKIIGRRNSRKAMVFVSVEHRELGIDMMVRKW